MLPPGRRRSPKTQKDEDDEASDTAMKITFICVLVIANLIVFVSKYAPDGHYAMAAAPSDTMQLSP
jgi:hypothetical protein